MISKKPNQIQSTFSHLLIYKSHHTEAEIPILRIIPKKPASNPHLFSHGHARRNPIPLDHWFLRIYSPYHSLHDDTLLVFLVSPYVLLGKTDEAKDMRGTQMVDDASFKVFRRI